jgi:alginate O-acetyltransferase complex protein AlgI
MGAPTAFVPSLDIPPSGTETASLVLFNSLLFFAFLAIVLPLYFSLKGRGQVLLCLIASYVFYGAWDWRFLGLIALSTIVDYCVALKLEASEAPAVRKRLLILSLALNLGLLGVFKYYNFFIGSFRDLLTSLGFSPGELTLEIILPVGISFYTFQTLSYTIDVYRREIRAERSLLRFATFVAFFPQLVAGPIVRASDFLPQLYVTHRFHRVRALGGAAQMALGFFKKIVVADSAALVVETVFTEPSVHTSIGLIVGVVFYAFQIYGDFAGYSDIAIGLARVMGFKFPPNFRQPYVSQSFSEFWTRWHISLSSWLRDYLYIPLGGNRHGTLATYRNLMITMLLGGLWHGAEWKFVIWGGLHGAYLILQRFLQLVARPAVSPPLRPDVDSHASADRTGVLPHLSRMDLLSRERFDAGVRDHRPHSGLRQPRPAHHPQPEPCRPRDAGHRPAGLIGMAPQPI